MSTAVTVGILCCLTLAHSLVGEVLLLRPLLTDRKWKVRVSRRDAGRILRFTWHAVAIAWLALAAILAGASPGVAVGAYCLLLGLALLALIPGHFAWTAFLAAGLYSLDSSNSLPRPVLSGLVVLGAVIAGLGALLHIAWALGSTLWKEHSYPEDPATLEPLARPGRVACLGAAIAAAAFAGLIPWVAFSAAPAWAWWAAAAALAVAALRSVGDRRQDGFLKTVRNTPYARLDTLVYTPLFTALAGSAWAALALAGLPG